MIRVHPTDGRGRIDQKSIWNKKNGKEEKREVQNTPRRVAEIRKVECEGDAKSGGREKNMEELMVEDTINSNPSPSVGEVSCRN